MRKYLICFFWLIFLSCVPFSIFAKLKTVVIDAGHGGHDPGCNHGKDNEKKITLAVALELGKKIAENYPDVKVIYTRKDDTFIELHERAGIANRHKADLFISIHVNSNNSKKVSGTETYTMGNHRSNDNLDVSKRENAVVLLENNFEKKYEGFDPRSPEGHIIFSMYQDAHINQSLKIATKVEKKLSETTGQISRGIKQAGFLVLWKTTMPSILIEIGYLSNEKERRFLATKHGQEKIAQGIYKAFSQYKKELENNQTK